MVVVECGVAGEGLVGGVFGILAQIRQWVLLKMICRVVPKV